MNTPQLQRSVYSIMHIQILHPADQQFSHTTTTPNLWYAASAAVAGTVLSPQAASASTAPSLAAISGSPAGMLLSLKHVLVMFMGNNVMQEVMHAYLRYIIKAMRDTYTQTWFKCELETCLFAYMYVCALYKKSVWHECFVR